MLRHFNDSSEMFFTAVSIRAASVNSVYQNIYLCTFRVADTYMMLRCTRKYQALLDGYNLWIKYEQLPIMD